jgi:hypothetical protein
LFSKLRPLSLVDSRFSVSRALLTWASVEASRSNKQSLAAPHLLEHSRPSLLDPPEHSQGKTGVTQELTEPTAVDGPFVVRASPKNKEEVGEVFLASIEVERAVVLQ